MLTIAGIGLAVAAQMASPRLAGSIVAAATNCIGIDSDDPVCEIVGELADLRQTVDELVTNAALAHSLDVKVDAVTASVLAGRYGAALNQLDAFENEVDAAEQSNRSYTAISNIMKSKHDTVKNSISNVR